MIIKVCGMRDAKNIRQLDEANIADWMGFIFFDKSSRNVTTLPDYLPKGCKRVGVFVDAECERIVKEVRRFSFDIIQLHGHEDVEYIRNLKSMIGNEIKIIKMIQIESQDDLDAANSYEGKVDYFLFETKCISYGGSGKQFDWGILNSYQGSTPFLITGGITSDDAPKVKAFCHPQFAGIDLNSRFEISPALKDIDLLKNFIKQLR